MDITILLDKYGLSPQSTEAEIKEAYRMRAMMYHPDRVQGNEKLQAFATEEMKRLNTDFDVIRQWFASGGASREANDSRTQSQSSQQSQYRQRADVQVYIDEADIYTSTGNYTAAISVLTRARSLDPNHIGVLFALGSALEGAGAAAKAMEIYADGMRVCKDRGKIVPFGYFSGSRLMIMVEHKLPRKIIRSSFKDFAELAANVPELHKLRDTLKKSIERQYGPIDVTRAVTTSIAIYMAVFFAIFSLVAWVTYFSEDTLVSSEVRNKRGMVIAKAVYTSPYKQSPYYAKMAAPNYDVTIGDRITLWSAAVSSLVNHERSGVVFKSLFAIGLIAFPLIYIFRGPRKAFKSMSIGVAGFLVYGIFGGIMNVLKLVLIVPIFVFCLYVFLFYHSRWRI